MEKTKGFVIKTLKYGDTSAILKVYTADFGIKTFLQKGYFNPKRKQLRSLQFPFAMAEFSFKENKKSNLILPSQISPIHAFVNLYRHPVKNLTLQFLAEIASLVLKEEEENIGLFNFLEDHLKLLNDKNAQFADFHLIFLMKQTQYLGISPNITNIENPYFDMMEGNFTKDKNATFLLQEPESLLWKKLINSEFTLESPNHFNQTERRILTHTLINYYKLHIPSFREPHSLEIIQEVFNS